MTKMLANFEFNEDAFANWMAGNTGHYARRWFNVVMSYIVQMAERADSLDADTRDIAIRCQHILDEINE